MLRSQANVCCDEGELSSGQGPVVRRGVLPLAHRQQRDPFAFCTRMLKQEFAAHEWEFKRFVL